MRLYDRLFTDPQPDAGGKDFKASLNPASLRVVTAHVEATLANAKPDQRFQIERHGYFVPIASITPGPPVLNRTATL